MPGQNGEGMKEVIWQFSLSLRRPLSCEGSALAPTYRTSTSPPWCRLVPLCFPRPSLSLPCGTDMLHVGVGEEMSGVT